MNKDRRNICMQFYVTDEEKAELDKLIEHNQIKYTNFLQEMIELMNGRKRIKQLPKVFISRLEKYKDKIIEYRKLGISIAGINKLINVELGKNKIGYHALRQFIVSNNL